MKPSNLRLEMKDSKNDILTVSNGSTGWQYVSNLKEYTLDHGALAGGDDKGQSNSQDTDPVAQMKNAMVFRYVGLARYIEYASLGKEAKLKLSGHKRPCYIVRVAIPNKENHKLWIDKESFLVLRHEEDSQAVRNSTKFRVHAFLEVEQAAVNFQPGPATFKLTLPAGAKEVAALDLPGPRPRLVGKPAPQFSLKAVNGEFVSLCGLKGKVVVLDFWATWCPPYRKELPTVTKINQEFRSQGVVMLGINTEDASIVRSFLKKNCYGLPTLMDRRRLVSRAYAVRFIPNLVIINRQGVVVAHFSGLEPEQQLVATLGTAGLEQMQN